MKKPYDPLTYTHPRTLEAAFGPYERWGELVEKDAEPEMSWEDKVLLWMVPAVVIFLMVLFALEGA